LLSYFFGSKTEADWLVYMNNQDQGMKPYVRSQEVNGAQQASLPEGREQFLLTSPELASRVGQKYCDEIKLVPLLVACGLVRRVRTIKIEVRPLGGDSFKVTLDASKPSVGEVKSEIARVQGTRQDRQELYKMAVKADGSVVREDDAEPALLDDNELNVDDGDLLVLAVTVDLTPAWTIFDKELVSLSEEGMRATCIAGQGVANVSFTSSTAEMTEGRHYWEVKVLSRGADELCVGVSRPNLDPQGWYGDADSSVAWLMEGDGCLSGNGEEDGEGASHYDQGDCIGVLLNLDNGSLLFFKNGVQNGPGYPAGSVVGPVVHALQLAIGGDSVRMLPGAAWPQGHSP
jgi:hypothetical protein